MMGLCGGCFPSYENRFQSPEDTGLLGCSVREGERVPSAKRREGGRPRSRGNPRQRVPRRPGGLSLPCEDESFWGEVEGTTAAEAEMSSSDHSKHQ